MKWYLGTLKGDGDRVYLEDFEWECGWYWSGGIISGDKCMCHFDGCFLDVPDTRGHPLGRFKDPWTKLPDWAKAEDYAIISNGASVWEPLSFFLDDAQYSEKEWWRIKDLFKQFYSLRSAAEVYQYGGHCTSDARDPRELSKQAAADINKHIGDVLIPIIRCTLSRQV